MLAKPNKIMNNNYWSLDCDVIQGPKDAGGVHFARAATPAIAIRICELLNIEDGPVQVLQKRIAYLESILSDIASGAACLGGYGIADAAAAARDALSANVQAHLRLPVARLVPGAKRPSTRRDAGRR